MGSVRVWHTSRARLMPRSRARGGTDSSLGDNVVCFRESKLALRSVAIRSRSRGPKTVHHAVTRGASFLSRERRADVALGFVATELE